jgi:hypothetical protein
MSSWFTLWLSKHRPSATPSTTFNLHDLPCGYQNIVHWPHLAPLLTYMIYLVAIKTPSIDHSQHHFQSTWFTLWLSKHRPSATPSTTFNLHDLPCGYQNIVHWPLPAPLSTYMIYPVAIKTPSIGHSLHFIGFDLIWCLVFNPLSAIFQLYHDDQSWWWKKPE